MSMEKGMRGGSESKLPKTDEEPTSGSENSEFYALTMSDSSATNSKPSSSSSAYQSSRIDSLRGSRGAYESPIEFEIAASKSHWTDLESDEEPACSPEDNLKYFESLQLRKRWACTERGVPVDGSKLVVGKKIAEGGQAEIYEVEIPGDRTRHVLKVFPEGYSVRSLHRQWPPKQLAQWQRYGDLSYLHHRTIRGAILLNGERFSNRFAFVMLRARSGVGRSPQAHRSAHAQPQAQARMLSVLHMHSQLAYAHHCIGISDMVKLHWEGVLHRDLKASNLLVEDPKDYFFSSDFPHMSRWYMVADFESSVGVVGTGFWRAPEILQRLKDGVSMSNVVFTPKADVYSFGMTCYEIVTGCLPFEGVPWQNYDHVLTGNQPTLPVDLDPLVQKMIRSCWQLDPVKRPTFTELDNEIRLFKEVFILSRVIHSLDDLKLIGVCFGRYTILKSQIE